MRSLTLPCILLLPLIVGCGDDPKRTADNPLATVSGFCQAWAELACNPDVVDYCLAEDAGACQASQADFCEELVPRVGYDSTNASQCLAAVEAAYADGDLSAAELLVVRSLGGDCSMLIRGDADEGEVCDKDSDCDTTAGFACVRRAGEDGTCQMPEEVEAGRSCSADNAVCAEGFYCDGRNCVERLSEDAACLDSSECASDLRCEASSVGEGGSASEAADGGTCVPRAGNSGSCETHDDCESGYCSVLSGSTGECVNRVNLGRLEPLCEQLR